MVGCFHIAHGIADVAGGGNVMIRHQLFDGFALAGEGVAVAQVTGEQMLNSQLLGTKFRIAAFAVADNKQAVVLF